MKKTLVVLFILMMVASGLVFASTEGTDQATLTLEYTKAIGTSTTIGWYDGYTSSASPLTAGDFGDGSVTAYLKVTNDYASSSLALSVVLPDLVAEDNTTISYSASLSLPAGVAENAALLSTSTALVSSSSGSALSFATVSKESTLKKTGIVQFVFEPNSNALSNATANIDYTANVVVTMTSET